MLCGGVYYTYLLSHLPFYSILYIYIYKFANIVIHRHFQRDTAVVSSEKRTRVASRGQVGYARTCYASHAPGSSSTRPPTSLLNEAASSPCTTTRAMPSHIHTHLLPLYPPPHRRSTRKKCTVYSLHTADQRGRECKRSSKF